MRVLATKKVLLPLATAAAAGALAVGSSASFSSQSTNTAGNVTSGTLTQSNSRSGQSVLSLSNMKPGDSVYGDVTITNTGSLPSALAVTESGTNPFGGLLTETIVDTKTQKTVASGTVGSLGKTTLGTWAKDESHVYRVTVTLSSDAGNDVQNKTASLGFVWDGTQTTATQTDATNAVTTPAAN